LQTNKLITQTLSSLGIMVAEHYLTVGEDYYGTEMHVGTFIRANMELRQFKKSKERSLAKRGREGELK